MYQRAGGAKNEKSISEAARLLDRWEYDNLMIAIPQSTPALYIQKL